MALFGHRENDERAGGSGHDDAHKLVLLYPAPSFSTGMG